jgi:YHS domain-containing protein
MAIDPICGMEVDEKSAIRVTKGDKEYFFCSTHCRDKFIKQEGIKDTAVCYPQAKKVFFKNN